MKGFFNTYGAVYQHEKENGLLPKVGQQVKAKPKTKKPVNTEMDEPIDEPTEPTEPIDEPTEPTEPTEE